MKIFPSAFPGWDTAKPWQYNAARYVASGVFLLGSVRILHALLSDRLAEVRAGLRRGHAVICGLDEVGLRCADALMAQGLRVTCLEIDTAGENAQAARAHGALVLRCDATDRAVLERVRVDRAERVICAGPDDETNTRIAAQVALITQAAGAWVGPSVHVKINDPDLTAVLQGPLATLGPTRLHFFSCAELWARLMLDHAWAGATGDPGGDVRLVVFGSTPVAKALVVEAARSAHRAGRASSSQSRMAIRLVCADAQSVATELAERYPRMSVYTDLEPAPTARTSRQLREVLSGVSVAFVALPDANATLSHALVIDRVLAGRAPVVMAESEGVTALGNFLSGVTNVQPVPLPRHLTTDLMHDQARDALARAVHAAFLSERVKAPDFGVLPADRLWSHLPARLRRANHEHADAMVDQLRSVWLEADSCDDWDDVPVQLPDATVEVLAQIEHERWRRTRALAGWTSSTTRDDHHKRHNLMVTWEELSDSAKQVNRALIRSWPGLLRQAGLRIGQSPNRERLARELHDRYIIEQGAGATQPRNWDELTEEARQWNRATVEHIAVKLAAIGCRFVPDTLAPLDEAHFSDPEVDALARLEHERWCEQRRAAGWAVGPRDETARTHPSLVSWDDLPGSEREKDRDVVRSIPDLLRTVGQVAVRISAQGRRRRSRLALSGPSGGTDPAN